MIGQPFNNFKSLTSILSDSFLIIIPFESLHTKHHRSKHYIQYFDTI